MPPHSARQAPGRRLKGPEMHYIPPVAVTTLSRLLVQCVKGRDHVLSDVIMPTTDVEGEDGAEEPKMLGSPKRFSITSVASHATKRFSTTSHSPRKRTGALGAIKRALYQDSAHRPSESGDGPQSSRGLASPSFPPVSASSSRSLIGTVQPHRPDDDDDEVSEYERKRQIHPRLRWPRLASRETDISRLCDGLDGTHPTRSDHFPDTSRPSASKSDVDDDMRSMDGRSVLSAASERSFVMGAHRPTKSSKTTRKVGPPARPAVLPRSVPYQQSPSGVVSTLHLPEDLLAWPQTSVDQMAMSTTSLKSFGSLAGSSRMSTATSCASSSRSKTVDRKWFMRMAPLSCLPSEPLSKSARRAATDAATSGQDGFDLGGELGEYLTFEKWGLSDDYIESLLSAHCSGDEHNLRGLRYLNLSDNRLTESGVQKLMENGLPDNLIGLNLASNGFGDQGGWAAVQLIKCCRHLKELDLSRNCLGDIVAEELCAVLQSRCLDLEGLGLGNCGLGTSTKCGGALGTLVGQHERLKSLDLSWNALHGPGAHSLLKGLYDNGRGLNLRRLNLAWNRLGSGQHSDPKRREDGQRAAKLLGSVFQDGAVLFHVDISYNGFIADDCAIIAAGLKDNHTLFGIHLTGNEATVDDLGFVVPLAGSHHPTSLSNKADESATGAAPETARGPSDGHSAFSAEEEKMIYMNSMSRSVHSGLRLENRRVARDTRTARSGGLGKLHLNPSLKSLQPDNVQCFSEEDLRSEHAWVEDGARIQTCADWVKSDFSAYDRNASHCWICENWIEHKVSYIPGFSGIEQNPEDVSSVVALFSIDGFTRPTRMRAYEETMKRTVCGMTVNKGRRRTVQSVSEANPSGERRSQLTLPLPKNAKQLTRQPSMASGEGGSQLGGLMLNAHGKVTKWVGVRMLPPTTESISVVFLVDGQPVVAKDMSQQKLAVPKEITLQTDEGRTTLTLTEVNIMDVGCSAWELFRRGRHHAVCVLEDPIHRQQVTLFPRTLPDAVSKEEKGAREWLFATSVFKDFSFDTAEKMEQCFDKDWTLGKLAQIIKRDETRRELCVYLMPKYVNLIMCYWNWTFYGCDVRTNAVGVSLPVFRDQMIQLGGRGPGQLIDGFSCKISDPDCIFVAANVIDKAKKTQIKVMPETGLARFQFLEAVVRLAFRRFLPVAANSSSTGECVLAVKQFFEMMSLGEELVEQRRAFHESLFTEECCLIFQDHMNTLKGIYEGYKMIFPHQGRVGKYMTFAGFAELMVDANVVTEQFSLKMCGAAFALAKEIRVDCLSDWRHMELSWSEFLIALAAIVKLQPEWEESFFADLLDEFFTEHIDEAYSKLMHRQPGRSKVNDIDPSLQPMVGFLIRIFEDADEDKNGSVDVREFRRALNPPNIKEEMQRLGFNVQDLDLLFRSVDPNGTGAVQLDALVDGFVKLKTAMKGMEKLISYVRKSFSEADKEVAGAISISTFRQHFEHPTMLRKLQAMGVSKDDVSDLLAIVDDSGSGSVRVDDIISVFVTLRDPKTRIVRGIRLLKLLFHQADADGHGSLDRSQVQGTFAQPEVEEKLKHLQLDTPNWLTLFEELDTNGDGDLDYPELQEGMTAYWAKVLL